MPGRRSSLRALLALAVLAVALAGCGASTSPLPKRTGPQLQSIFEDEGLLHANPAQALATFASLGVDRVRVYIPWDELAPDPTSPVRPSFRAEDPAAYAASAWAPYDAIVRAAQAAHVGLDVTIGPPAPLWAAGSGAPPRSPYRAGWKPSAAAFGAFVHAVGERYSGGYRPPGASAPLPRVGFWAIWNEPNYGHYLSPQTVDSSQVEVAPSLYRSLLDAAWSALAATGHSSRSDTILIGETAPRGLNGPGQPGAFDGMVPLRFIRALYCVGPDLRPLRGTAALARGCPATASGSAHFPAAHPALFQAGGFADHPYPDALPPNVRTPPPVGTGYADFAALASLQRTLDGAAAAYGSHRRLTIYSTEFGYRTNPPNRQLGVPLADAARYLNQAEYLSWRDPRIGSFDQYLLADPPPTARSAFVTGLEFYTGKPKPGVFSAWELPLYLPRTRFHRGSRLEVWGCVRPAPRLMAGSGAPQRVSIEFARSGSGAFHVQRSVGLSPGSCYFDVAVAFPGSGEVRLAWRHGGGTVFSRTQTVTEG